MKQPKIYNVCIYDDIDSLYVCYHRDDDYLYLVNINDNCDSYKFLKINSKDKNKEYINDYEVEYFNIQNFLWEKEQEK